MERRPPPPRALTHELTYMARDSPRPPHPACEYQRTIFSTNVAWRRRHTAGTYRNTYTCTHSRAWLSHVRGGARRFLVSPTRFPLGNGRHGATVYRRSHVRRTSGLAINYRITVPIVNLDSRDRLIADGIARESGLAQAR